MRGLADFCELSCSSINKECTRRPEEQVFQEIKTSKCLEVLIIDALVSDYIWDAVIANPNIKKVEFQKLDVKAQTVLKVFRLKSIKHICFRGARRDILGIDDENVFLMDEIQTKKGLEGIELHNVSNALAQSASLQSSVCKLQIHKGGVKKDGFDDLVEAFPRLASLKQLEIRDDDLVIDNNSAHAFAQVCRNMQGNVEIELPVLVVDGAYEMLAALVSNTSLNHVSLDCSLFEDYSPIVTFRSIDGVLYLDGFLSDDQEDRHVREIALEIVAQIANGIRKPKHLELSRCGFGPHDIQSLCDALVDAERGTGVESLGLQDDRVDAQGLISLGRMLHRIPTLTKLVLSSSGISGDLICAFCNALVPTETLKDVDLSYNDIGNRGAAALAKCIINEKLRPKSLTLASNRIGDDGAVALAECLANDELLLRTLRVDSNDFGLTGMQAIANALARPTAPLEVLELGGIEYFGDDTFESLGNALKTNTKLRNLRMTPYSTAPVSARGIRALLDGVKAHPTLEVVDVSHTEFTELQADELNYYLELNKGARRLLQVQPPLPQALWPRVLAKADGCRKDGRVRLRAPDVLYYFIKEKCDLFSRNAEQD